MIASAVGEPDYVVTNFSPVFAYFTFLLTIQNVIAGLYFIESLPHSRISDRHIGGDLKLQFSEVFQEFYFLVDVVALSPQTPKSVYGNRPANVFFFVHFCGHSSRSIFLLPRGSSSCAPSHVSRLPVQSISETSFPFGSVHQCPFSHCQLCSASQNRTGLRNCMRNVPHCGHFLEGNTAPLEPRENQKRIEPHERHDDFFRLGHEHLAEVNRAIAVRVAGHSVNRD